MYKHRETCTGQPSRADTQTDRNEQSVGCYFVSYIYPRNPYVMQFKLYSKCTSCLYFDMYIYIYIQTITQPMSFAEESSGTPRGMANRSQHKCTISW